MQQIQEELMKTLKTVSELSTELNEVNKRVSFLNNDRVEKGGNMIEELKVANRQMAHLMSANTGGDKDRDRTPDIKLIDMKVMNPKSFDGK